MVGGYILKSRGIFWWDDTPVPVSFLAPENAVSGTLTVTSNGTSELELNGTLLSIEEHVDSVTSKTGLEVKRDIRGRLKSDGLTVVLRSVFNNGGSFGNKAFESSSNYSAYEALIGPDLKGALEVACAEKMTVCLEGLEEWTWSGAIDLHRTQDEAKVNYAKPPDYTYAGADATLSITYYLDSTYPGTNHHAVYLKSRMYLEYGPARAVPPLEIQDVYRAMIDFLTLLIGHPVALDWPWLYLGPERKVRYYFHRAVAEPFEAKMHDRWVRFDDIRTRFGPLFFNWLTERERFGPAFYLFLGYKRLKTMYAEHQFINLAWAIEAFSRVAGIDEGSSSVQERIDRILGGVADGGDKAWLKKRLRNAAEPNLEQRIFTVLYALPFELRDEELRKFAASCAQLRNSISHFGGPRLKGETYQDFLVRLRDHIYALEYLYHCRILKSIGLKDVDIVRGALTGLRSFHIKHHLTRVKLVAPEWKPTTEQEL